MPDPVRDDAVRDRARPGPAALRPILFGSAPGQGLCVRIAELALGLRSAGAAPTVVTGPGEQSPGTRDRLAAAGIPVHLVPGADAHWARPDPAAVAAIAAILERERAAGPVVLHGFTVRNATLAWRARRAAGSTAHPGERAPILIQLESLRHGTRYEAAAYLAGAAVLRATADVVIALCDDERRKLRRAALPAARLAVVHNWVDMPAFEHAAARPLPADVAARAARSIAGTTLPARAARAVYPAQLIARKGHATLFAALARLRARGVELACICPGAGAEEAAVRAAAAAAGVADLVSLPGLVDAVALPALLRTADLAVVTSHAETFGFVLAEPLALGVPLVTTRVGVAHELERAGGARVVAPGDAPALADALAWTLAHPVEARAAAAAGGAYVRNACALETVVDRLLSLYAGALRRETVAA